MRAPKYAARSSGAARASGRSTFRPAGRRRRPRARAPGAFAFTNAADERWGAHPPCRPFRGSCTRSHSMDKAHLDSASARVKSHCAGSLQPSEKQKAAPAAVADYARGGRSIPRPTTAPLPPGSRGSEVQVDNEPATDRQRTREGIAATPAASTSTAGSITPRNSGRCGSVTDCTTSSIAGTCSASRSRAGATERADAGNVADRWGRGVARDHTPDIQIHWVPLETSAPSTTLHEASITTRSACSTAFAMTACPHAGLLASEPLRRALRAADQRLISSSTAQSHAAPEFKSRS
jgi:hypothetical protein